jgi:hypothetical protein
MLPPKDISILWDNVKTTPKTTACVAATTILLPPGGRERTIPGVNKKNKTAEKINIIKFILLNI